MIKIPNNITICQDCMQRTFDSMNKSGFHLDDILGPMRHMDGRMPNISMINLSDLQNFMPGAQKVKYITIINGFPARPDQTKWK